MPGRAEDDAARLRRQGPADDPQRRPKRRPRSPRSRRSRWCSRPSSPFEKEISVIAARGARRRGRAPTSRPRTSTATTSSRPAPSRPTISAATAEEAHRLAGAIVTALDYVGVLGVEFFVLPRRQAPLSTRSRRACTTPATGPRRSASPTSSSSTSAPSPAGRSATAPARAGGDGEPDRRRGRDSSRLRWGPGSGPQLYGKAESRPGRKMGHINRIGVERSASRSISASPVDKRFPARL